MRPRPDGLFCFLIFSAEVTKVDIPISQRTDEVQAAVFNRDGVSKRDGFIKEVRQVFEGDGVADTVTETLRQTITVNGAGAFGPSNVTITETVTVAASASACPALPNQGEEGIVEDEAFEGYVALPPGKDGT